MLERKKNFFYISKGLPFVKLTKEIASHLDLDNNRKLDLANDRLDRSMYLIRNTKYEHSRVRSIYFLDWADNFGICKLDSKEIFTRLLLSTFSAVPINSCEESSRSFMKNASDISNHIPCFRINRRKDSLFKDNVKIAEHFKRTF